MVDRESLIDRIYEAAIVPELWPGVLHDVSALGGCFGGILFTTAARQITHWTSSDDVHGLFEDFLANREAQDDNIRLKHGIAAKHHGFFGNHQLYGRAEMERSAMYTTFFFPKGLGYAAGTVLPMPNGDLAVFDLERRLADGPASAEELARLDAIRPHLARAAALSTRLGLERAKAIVEALGQAGMPAAVLGAGDRVLAANQPFRPCPGRSSSSLMASSAWPTQPAASCWRPRWPLWDGARIRTRSRCRQPTRRPPAFSMSCRCPAARGISSTGRRPC